MASGSPLPAPHHDLRQDHEIKDAVDAAVKASKCGTKIVIIGWPRGAIRAMFMAQLLNEKKVGVEFLGLADPVGTMYKGYDRTVPGNVVHVFHSYKKDKWSGYPIYNNEPIDYAPGVDATKHEFEGTHAANSATTLVAMKKDANARGVPLGR